MKIIIFSPFYPPHIGGLESHSDEFNKHLAARGAEITVFTPRLPKDAPENEIRYKSVRIVRFPAWELFHNYPLPAYWPFWWSFDFFRLFRKLLREKPDLVISRTRFFAPSLLAVFYARLKHIPLVHIEHGSDFAKFNGTLKTKLGELYDWIFGRFVLRSADLVIGNSEASAHFVRTLSGRTDCKIIYRGVETEKISNIFPDTAFSKNKIHITYLGRLIDGKGVIDLLQALTKLNLNTFHCHIIGNGPELKRLQTFAQEHHLEDNLTFHGHQSFENAIALLKASDIIVNPSYTEGLPTSITEAALCKKAIIATNVGGTPEIISGIHDGYLIEPKNTSQLIKALTDLIEHPEKRLLFGQNAYQSVKAKFDWNESAKKYLAVFQELLDNRK